ncbi:hypothetical protein EV361DRAFT_952938 [Lentinula raphanica]|nr:hypothetical protein F5880DRAFT_1610897 [Lentinula raphanica]KAJ3967754.1 hypothetical protein EV361DRAFT_952938 [Lentinula raphanica]
MLLETKGLLFVDVLDQYIAELSQFEGDAEAAEQWISCNTTTSKRLEEKALAEGWQIEVERFRIMKGCFVSTLACNHVKINKKTKKDLVQDDWLRLRPLVLEPLQRQRRFLLGQAMHQRLTILHETYTRFQSLHVRNAIWPSLGDLIVRDGPIKELLQTTPLDRNPGVTMRDLEFRLNVTKTFVASRFAQFSHTWRLDKEKELYQMLRDAVSITSNGNDSCLATTIFRCNAPGCGFALYFPDVFQHRCTTSYDFDSRWDIAPGIPPPNPYLYESYVVS